ERANAASQLEQPLNVNFYTGQDVADGLHHFLSCALNGVHNAGLLVFHLVNDPADNQRYARTYFINDSADEGRNSAHGFINNLADDGSHAAYRGRATFYNAFSQTLHNLLADLVEDL